MRERLLSPFDVTLFKGEKKDNICVVQPDIFVICDREKIDAKGNYQGTPTLVVEVLSDSTRNKDLTKKLSLYMESGVKEYWIVNMTSEEIYIYAFSNHTIENIRTFKGDETAESVFFKGLAVKKAAIRRKPYGCCVCMVGDDGLEPPTSCL